MKTEWRKLTDRIKRGGGWSTINEPKWCKILNEIFAEAHENLAASARAEDLSFSLNEESDLSTSSSEENEENHIKSPQVNGEETQKKKLVTAPHKKRKLARSQTQGMSQLASGMEKIAAAALKKQELLVERDLKREEMYLVFRREETEKNREHELRIAEMYVKMFLREMQPNVLPNPINLPPPASNPRNILHTNSQPFSYEHTMLNRSPVLRSQTDCSFSVFIGQRYSDKGQN